MGPLDVLLEPAMRALLAGLLVDDRGVRAERSGGARGERQRLVVDLDQPERLLGGGRILGHDGHDRLAREPDLPDGDQGVVRDRVAVDEVHVRQVVCRDDRDHAGMLARGGRVDAADPSVRVGAAQQLGVSQPGHAQVHREAAPAGHLVDPVASGDGFADRAGGLGSGGDAVHRSASGPGMAGASAPAAVWGAAPAAAMTASMMCA
jgi:hypothetical protein